MKKKFPTFVTVLALAMVLGVGAILPESLTDEQSIAIVVTQGTPDPQTLFANSDSHDTY